MATIYDRADIYDLLEDEQRYQWYLNHWKKILEGKHIHSFLDVSIGSGSVSLPLCDLGISLTGTDLSRPMLERCISKAKRKGFQISTAQSDFRNVSSIIREEFDCVGSTGNSLAYVDNDDVIKTLQEMNKLVRPGGYLYFDSRNWEKILREHQRFYLYNPLFRDDVRINFMQFWDYPNDGSIIFNLLYTFEKDNRIVQKEHFEEHYHPVSSSVLLEALEKMGYKEVEVYSFPAIAPLKPLDDLEWYSVIAQKGD